MNITDRTLDLIFSTKLRATAREALTFGESVRLEVSNHVETVIMCEAFAAQDNGGMYLEGDFNPDTNCIYLEGDLAVDLDGEFHRTE